MDPNSYLSPPTRPGATWLHTIPAVKQLEDTLMCGICNNLLSDPYCVGGCEHSFCRVCVEKHIGKTCPMCHLPCAAKEAKLNKYLDTLVKICKDLKAIVVDYDSSQHLEANIDEDDDTEAGDLVKENASEAGTSVTDVEAAACSDDTSNSANKSADTENEPDKVDCEKRKQNEPLVLDIASSEENDAWCETKEADLVKKTSVAPVKRKAAASKEDPQACQQQSKRRSLSTKIKRNVRGETPLHIAAIKNDIPALKELLISGADTNVKDNAGWTALHEACIRGYSEAAALLIDHGALVDVPGLDNFTPLHDAVQANHVETAKLLVESGANVLARNSKGITALMMAQTEEMKAVLKTSVSALKATAPQALCLNAKKTVILGSHNLDDSQKGKLSECAMLMGATVQDNFTKDVTHLVVACDSNGNCQRTLKYLHGILSGVWIVSFHWVTTCLERKSKVPEEPFEVKGTKQQPESYGPKRGRLNTLQQMPPLFDGCQFYFRGQFVPPSPSRDDLIALVRRGGGRVLMREPRWNQLSSIEKTYPYHADADSRLSQVSFFIVYREIPASKKKLVEPPIMYITPSWILNSIGLFKLTES